MINALRLVIFGFAFITLAVAFSLQNIESAIIDFTAIPNQELQMFRFGFFVIFVALMLLTVVIDE